MLEAGLGGVQEGVQRMEMSMMGKMHQLEETINKLSEALISSKALLSNKGESSHSNTNRESNSRPMHEENETNQKISLASFHLEGEANQWWQWARRTYREERRTMTWEAFEEELWTRFGPTDCEDFDEALSHIKQVGSLHDYQSEFEKLGNRVHGWTQKALVGTFMGGLKPEIAEGIRMFKPQSLKEAISLARMKDE
uniref:Ty3 transposon capsid-like protein domain-containing protein n=1 Tax=Populus alba TaxID=43335 RepID=A0A4U5R378_POPAL|nr:hypothetical protein D5086_0000005970 [Populus alba]